jgi:hypothetical protein
MVRWQRGNEKAGHRDDKSTSVEDIGHESNKVTTGSMATEQPQTLALVRRRRGKVMTEASHIPQMTVVGVEEVHDRETEKRIKESCDIKLITTLVPC